MQIKKIATVVSNKMNKTIIAVIENKYSHPLYGKIIKKTSRFMAHDEYNQCNIGDKVLIKEIRPLSKKKRWLVKQILIKI